MPLIPYPDIDNADLPPELLNSIKNGRGGGIPNVYKLLLHAPTVLEGWLHLSNQVRFASVLEAPSRELLILLVAHLTDCAYEWDHHRPLAVKAGVPDTDIDAIRDWPDLSGVTSADIALLTFAGAMVTRTAVADSRVAAWANQADPQLVMETAMMTSYYLGLAHLILALGIEDEKAR